MHVRKAASSSTHDAATYFPRRLALVAPQGESVFEFVVTGQDRVGILKEMCAIFAKHYVTLTSLDVDLVASGEFVNVSYADFRNADAPAKLVQKEIAALRSVRKVVYGRATDVLFEKFMFPITAGGSARAIILPVSALIGFEQAVLLSEGKQGERHLIEIGRPVGRGVANTLRSYLPWADSKPLVGAAVDAMRAMGWGLCSFDLSRVKDGRVSVVVKNPMFAGLTDASVSWLLVGVTSGLLEDVVPFPNKLLWSSVKSRASELSFVLEASSALGPKVSASGKRRKRPGRN